MRAQSHVLDLRALPAGGGSRQWHAAFDDCVLLIDRRGFDEFARLEQMVQRLRIPVVRLDEHDISTADIDYGPDDRALSVGGARLRPSVTWIRHLDIRAIPTAGPAATTMFRADSCLAFLNELSRRSDAAVPGRYPGRMEQLDTAVTVGLDVPRTRVTTDPAGVAEWAHSPQVIVKALHEHVVEPSPGVLVFAYPEVIATVDTAGMAPFGVPAIVQEYLPHDERLRVYCLGGDCVAYRVSGEQAGLPGRDDHDAIVVRTGITSALAQRLARLTSAMGMHYGAIDLLVADDRVTFLEINPDGDWAWFEDRAADDSVTRAAAHMLSRLRPSYARQRTPPSVVGLLGTAIKGAS